MSKLNEFEQLVCAAYDSGKVKPEAHTFLYFNDVINQYFGCALGAGIYQFCGASRDFRLQSIKFGLNSYQVYGITDGFDGVQENTCFGPTYLRSKIKQEYKEGYEVGKRLRLKYLKMETI